MQRECLHRVHSFEPLALITLTLALTLCTTHDPSPNQAGGDGGGAAHLYRVHSFELCLISSAHLNSCARTAVLAGPLAPRGCGRGEPVRPPQ